MTVRHAFEIASITKTLTAVCVLLLREGGQIELDAPMIRYLDPHVTRKLLVLRGRDYTPEITVRQLLSHRSGLPDYWSDGPYTGSHDNAFLHAFKAHRQRFWDPQDVLHYVRKLKPVGKPGKRYHYSDTNYLLLGLAIEHLTRKPLNRVFRERLFTPLQMHSTYFSYREAPPRGLIESHRYEAKLDISGQERQSADWAGGGLVSTAADLSRFLLALEQGRLFRTPQTLTEMRSWAPTDQHDVGYGLGLFRVTLESGPGWLEGHDGHGNSFMYYWPQQQIALVGTLNQTSNDWWPLVVGVLREVTRDHR